MENKRLMLLGKLLFSLSFVFIFTGLYLNKLEKQMFYDPINDVVAIAPDDGDKVIISTTDGDIEEVNNNPSTPIDNGSNNENNTDNTNTDTNNNSSNSTDNSSNYNNKTNTPDNSNNSNEDTNTDINPSTSNDNIIDENDVLRRSIEDTYGIKVKYGDEISNYQAGSMNVTPILDKDIIKSGLEQLKETLSLYPQDFFREFLNENLNLEVFLIKNYSKDNVTGVTDLFGNRVIVSIAMDYPFFESFNHEIYHYIEHFIVRKQGEFSAWNMYNPNDFSYGTVNSNYSYTKTQKADSVFVNNYAQTNPYEDRASTFEYMMASNKIPCFNSTTYPIWKKSSYMALMIDTYFDTVSPSIIDYWERFIY